MTEKEVENEFLFIFSAQKKQNTGYNYRNPPKTDTNNFP